MHQLQLLWSVKNDYISKCHSSKEHFLLQYFRDVSNSIQRYWHHLHSKLSSEWDCTANYADRQSIYFKTRALALLPLLPLRLQPSIRDLISMFTVGGDQSGKKLESIHSIECSLRSFPSYIDPYLHVVIYHRLSLCTNKRA